MRTFVILAFFLVSMTAESQVRPNMNSQGVPRQPNENDIKRYKEKMEERLEDYISNFMGTLDADEFQKVIIRQKLDSYLEKKRKILDQRYERDFERVEAIKQLDENHFKDLEGLASDGDMDKIKVFIKGEFDDKEVKKKKRRNRKKNKNKEKQ